MTRKEFLSNTALAGLGLATLPAIISCTPQRMLYQPLDLASGGDLKMGFSFSKLKKLKYMQEQSIEAVLEELRANLQPLRKSCFEISHYYTLDTLRATEQDRQTKRRLGVLQEEEKPHKKIKLQNPLATASRMAQPFIQLGD